MQNTKIDEISRLKTVHLLQEVEKDVKIEKLQKEIAKSREITPNPFLEEQKRLETKIFIQN